MILVACIGVWLMVFTAYVWCELWQQWAWEPGPSRENIPYQTYQPKLLGGKKDFYIGVPIRGPLRFTIRRETWLDRIVKFFRLATEIQTGDADFDKQLYVVCDDADWPMMLDEYPELRQLVRMIFNTRATELTLKSKCLYVKIQKEWEYGFVRTMDIVKCLTSISEIIQARSIHAESTLNSSYRLQGVLFAGAHIGWLVTGIVFGAGLIVWGHPFFHVWAFILLALRCTAITALLWLVALCVFMRGSSRSASVFRHFLAYGVCGLFLTFCTGQYAWNQMADTSPIQPHLLSIIPQVSYGGRLVHSHRGRRSFTPSYIVYLEPLFPEDGDHFRLYVSRSEANALSDLHAKNPNQPYHAQLNVRAGALGFPWIESYALGVK